MCEQCKNRVIQDIVNGQMRYRCVNVDNSETTTCLILLKHREEKELKKAADNADKK